MIRRWFVPSTCGHNFIFVIRYAFGKHRGQVRPTRSPPPVRSQRHSARTIIKGSATPQAAKMMWKPRDMAIWERAARRSVTGERSELAQPASEGASPGEPSGGGRKRHTTRATKGVSTAASAMRSGMKIL